MGHHGYSTFDQSIWKRPHFVHYSPQMGEGVPLTIHCPISCFCPLGSHDRSRGGQVLKSRHGRVEGWDHSRGGRHVVVFPREVGGASRRSTQAMLLDRVDSHAWHTTDGLFSSGHRGKCVTSRCWSLQWLSDPGCPTQNSGRGEGLWGRQGSVTQPIRLLYLKHLGKKNSILSYYMPPCCKVAF